jgi:hypothetical protein
VRRLEKTVTIDRVVASKQSQWSCHGEVAVQSHGLLAYNPDYRSQSWAGTTRWSVGIVPRDSARIRDDSHPIGGKRLGNSAAEELTNVIGTEP